MRLRFCLSHITGCCPPPSSSLTHDFDLPSQDAALYEEYWTVSGWCMKSRTNERTSGSMIWVPEQCVFFGTYAPAPYVSQCSLALVNS